MALMWGTPLSPEQAVERMRTEKIGSRFAPAQLTLAYTATETALPTYYVFNAQEGYVIASADDMAEPILGYVDNGSFDYASIPEQMRWWLAEYASQIDAARQQNSGQNANFVRMARPSRPAIRPLVNTRWNQSAPYNNLCPLYDGTNRAATGCVATAMAQVLRFWKYPAKGTGSNSYTYEGITNSFDFGNTTFDWGNMIHTYVSGSYTTAQASAVATLMRACGVAVNMMYGSSSGAYSADVPGALIGYFNYSPSAYLAYRQCYNLYDWEDLVYGELASKAPVYYAGHGTAGGHAFVCDGYEGDGYFHFNWGWGGSSDGYFLLGALNPTTLGIGGGGGGFNQGQSAIIGLRPTTAGQTAVQLGYTGDFTIAVSGSRLTLTGFGGNFGTTVMPKVAFCYRLTPTAGGTSYVINGSSLTNLKPRYGLNSNSATISSSVPAGKYVIEPFFKASLTSSGSLQDYEAIMPPAMKGKYILTVTASGSSYSYSVADVATTKPAVADFSVNSPLYVGGNFNFTAKYSNSGTDEFYAPFYMGWFNSSNSLIGVGDAMMTEIAAGESRSVNMSIAVPTKVNVSSSSTAALSTNTNYKVALLYSNGSNYVRLTPYVTVTINPAQGDFTMTCQDFAVDNSAAANANDINFHFTLKAPAGYYYSNPIYFWARYNGTSIYNGSTEPVIVGNGQSVTVNWRFQFEAGVVGRTYQLLLNYRGKSGNKYLGQANFTIGTAGVDAVGNQQRYTLLVFDTEAQVTAPRAIKSIEVFDMAGMNHRVESNIEGDRASFGLETLPGGVYIVRVQSEEGSHTFRLVR